MKRGLAGKEARLQRVAERILGIMPSPASSVTVQLLPDREMRGLARAFFKKDKRQVTVLAFPQPPGFPSPERRGLYVGEVYLNAELAYGEAELRFFLIHGILHLLGYRHGRKNDTIRMETLEDKLCPRVRARRPTLKP